MAVSRPGISCWEMNHMFAVRHLRNGFVHIDTIDPLPGWEPGNPAAIYVAALRPTR